MTKSETMRQRLLEAKGRGEKGEGLLTEIRNKKKDDVYAELLKK